MSFLFNIQPVPQSRTIEKTEEEKIKSTVEWF